MQDIQAIAFILALSLSICAAIALYTHLAGFSGRATLQTAETARQKLEGFYPNSPVNHVKIAADGRTALGLFDDGSGGLLYALGDNWLFQPLVGGDIQQAKTARNGKLRLAFNEYTAPNITISLEDEAMQSIWRDALEPFFGSHIPKTKPALTAKQSL